MTKKLIAILLTLCLLMGMTTVALATEAGSAIIDDDDGNRTTDDTIETDNDANKKSLEVTAILQNSETTAAPIIYNVELIWGDQAWAWGTQGGEATWDPINHVETITGNVDTEGWYLISDATLSATYTSTRSDMTGSYTITDLGDQGDILVFNHSNAAVDVTASHTDATNADNNVKVTAVSGFGAGTGTTTDAGSDNKVSLNAAKKVESSVTKIENAAAIVYATDSNTGSAAKFSAEPTATSATGLNNEGSTTTIATLTVTLSEPTTDNEGNT